MKFKKSILVFSVAFLTALSSCLNKASSDYIGVKEYDNSVSEVNSGYSKLDNIFTYKDTQNHSFYSSYTPSTGDINMLAIPVKFVDSKIATTEQINAARENISKSLFGESSDTGWESVASYYKKSSFGKLNFSGTVSDAYIYEGTANDFAFRISEGRYSTLNLINDAIDWYKKKNPTVDMTIYDNDKDGYLDGVYLLYFHEYFGMDNKNLDLDPDVFWAYCSWTSNYPNIESPVAGVYFWCSYYFLFEGYGENTLDSHTFIHETGHMLGLDDYYSYNSIRSNRKLIDPSPIGGFDMMDLNIIDHNVFSKFALGWVNPYLIDKEGSLTIKKSSTSGECVLIPTGKYNKSPFDEYLLLELFSPDNLNESDLSKGYAPRDKLFGRNGKLDSVGVRVYHVDARLMIGEIYLGEYISFIKYVDDFEDLKKLERTKYAVVAHSNTPDGEDDDGSPVESYNYSEDKRYRLIQAITPEGVDYSATSRYVSNNSLFYKNGSMKVFNSTFKKQFPNKKEAHIANNGGDFLFDFTVSEISKDACKLTFTSSIQ